MFQCRLKLWHWKRKIFHVTDISSDFEQFFDITDDVFKFDTDISGDPQWMSERVMLSSPIWCIVRNTFAFARKSCLILAHA